MATKRRRLARQRRSAGLSQEALAAALGVDRSTVVRWEAGETEPQPWLRNRLAVRLGISLVLLDELLAETGAIDPTADPPGEVPPGDPRRVDLTAVAALRERISRVQAEYDLAPSTELVAEAAGHLSRITFLRTNAPVRRVRQALGSLEAASATLVGQLIWDASQRRDHRAPRQYFNQAIEAARQVNDGIAESYATLRTSYLALYGEKRPREGLAAAKQAASVGRWSSPALTGLSLLHVAEANAMLGNRRDCEHALDEAQDQLSLVDDTDIAGDYLTASEIDRLMGSCYLFLDLPKRAEEPLQQAASALIDKKKSQAIVLGNLSLARIRQGEVDAAVEALNDAIDALEATRGGGGLNLAFTAGQELRPWRQQAVVQDVGERLFALMAGS